MLLPIFISVTLMFPFNPLSQLGKISKLPPAPSNVRLIIIARMKKVHLGSQSPNTSSHPQPTLATGGVWLGCIWALFMLGISLSLSPSPGISPDQSHIWAPVQTLLPSSPCLCSVATKSPYYEPSNLGPATIGIWHQIFISPLDTISVTSDRHGSPICLSTCPVPVRPPRQCRLRNDKKRDRPGLGRKAKLEMAFVSGEGECCCWLCGFTHNCCARLAWQDGILHSHFCTRLHENTNWKCFLVETARINLSHLGTISRSLYFLQRGGWKKVKTPGPPRQVWSLDKKNHRVI